MEFANILTMPINKGKFLIYIVIRTKYLIAIFHMRIYTIYNKKSSIYSHLTKNFFRELITIDIEIKKRSRIKEFIHKIYSKLEDIAFTIIMHLPERFVPHFLMKWLDKYTTKRISQLKQQTIKQTWRKLSLEQAVNEISNRQQHSAQ